jgi:dipeptidyl aminopeptidase/acylaminoacyl peptidase
MSAIESLLSARLFLAPQAVGERLFFVSNLSGRLSLYAMDAGGSVPEPLLPPGLALQNPDLVGGYPFYVFPRLGRILVMLDRDGDENYQPMLIPLDGGFPQPAFGDALAGFRVGCTLCDPERGLVYLVAQSRSDARNVTYRGDLASRQLETLAESAWGHYPMAHDPEHRRVALLEGYTAGDTVLSLWEAGERRVLHGTPLEQRLPGEPVKPSAIFAGHFAGDGLLFTTALFDDAYGLAYLPLDTRGEVQPVAINGTTHTGTGELDRLEDLGGGRFAVGYNIDGSTWLYEGRFDPAGPALRLERLIAGAGELAGGVAESVYYDHDGQQYALSFSTAVSPTQIYTVGRNATRRHTRERVLGIPAGHLSPGEDASFSSHDGLRVSARLYLPAPALGYDGPRPLVYYIHGGPQGQERPNFAWFSMPLIQLLTLEGFAVFVPNARGSTGYGLDYMKRVDRDWGGQDRLDHVHAMTAVLPRDPRVDVTRAGVVGRSYGGYMTLTLAARHPELWRAAVDMFGPYDLLTFLDRIPPTWKPYFSIAVGDPERDRDLLVERSPRSSMEQIACPLLVIQGKNDPRVVEQESRDVVDQLRAAGKHAEYLLFEDEGHDVLKHDNRITCYNAIARFFGEHLA